jgi:hypothetical protein
MKVKLKALRWSAFFIFWAAMEWSMTAWEGSDKPDSHAVSSLIKGGGRGDRKNGAHTVRPY